MSLLSCIFTHLGHRLTAPGGLGGGCVGWVNIYLQDVFATPPVHANAVDWKHAAIPGFARVTNGPTNFPPYGAIVVWGPSPLVGITVFGRVAVAVLADSMRLLTLDQNWPEGSPLALVAHSYAGVLGWWVPPHAP